MTNQNDKEILQEVDEQVEELASEDFFGLDYEEDDEGYAEEYEIEYNHIFLEENVIVYCKSDGSWFTETYKTVEIAKKIYDLKTC